MIENTRCADRASGVAAVIAATDARISRRRMREFASLSR
jgi:hypothetical protein